jgi:hypothetical protein
VSRVSELIPIAVLQNFVAHVAEERFLHEQHLTLLPILLNSIGDDAPISTKTFDTGEHKDTTGRLFKRRFIDYLLDVSWQKTHIIAWITIFRELVPTDQQLRALIQKARR